MASSALPAKLKTPDLQRFAHRAAQLEKVRPIVTYWCEYYILQHILERQLHATDEECTQYAIRLMDKLEQYKSANQENDAVIDDIAAKAYVEAFALETFERADGSQRTNTVKAQTADTFQAAMTFMDLLTIWGPLETEIAAKKKYAKFHAVRIAKAIKAGKDPNADNPIVEPPPAPIDLEMENGIEAELKDLERDNDAGIYQPPTVESVPESRIPSRPQSTLHADPTAAPVLPTIPSQHVQPEPDVSPIDPPDVNSRTGSVGGGYFPAVPNDTSPVLSTAPLDQPPSGPSLFAPADPAAFYSNTPQQPFASTPKNLDIHSPDRLSRPGPDEAYERAPSDPTTHAFTPQPVSQLPMPPPPLPVSSHIVAPTGGYRTDDDAIMAAQKHAKWAISALNFEDVNTAVSELRIALQSLGAA